MIKVRVTRVGRGKIIVGDMYFRSQRHAKSTFVQLYKAGKFRRAEYDDGNVVTASDIKAWLKKG